MARRLELLAAYGARASKDVAGVALSALLRGCADRDCRAGTVATEVGAGLHRRGRRGTFGTPEGLRRQVIAAARRLYGSPVDLWLQRWARASERRGRRGIFGTLMKGCADSDCVAGCTAHRLELRLQRWARSLQGVAVRGIFGTPEGLRRKGCRASPAIRFTSITVVAEVGAGLRRVAGVAISALLRGSADSGCRSSPAMRFTAVEAVVFSALLRGCADRVAEAPAIRFTAERRGTFRHS